MGIFILNQGYHKFQCRNIQTIIRASGELFVDLGSISSRIKSSLRCNIKNLYAYLSE